MRPRIRILFLLPLLALAGGASAAPQDEREYKIEAAFLYNFFNYITWPGYNAPSDLKQVTICLAGNDPIVPYLDYVRTKMAGERSLDVRTVGSGEPLKGCTLLFERGEAPSSTSPAILTVSDHPGYIDHGGMIAIAQDNGHLAMAINNDRLSERGFQVSSRLLQLAKEVK